MIASLARESGAVRRAEQRAPEGDGIAQQPERVEEQHLVGVDGEEMVPHHIRTVSGQQQRQPQDRGIADGSLTAHKDPAEHHDDSPNGR